MSDAIIKPLDSLNLLEPIRKRSRFIEESILASIYNVFQESMAYLSETLIPEHFLESSNRELYQLFLDTYSAGKQPDITVLLSDKFNYFDRIVSKRASLSTEGIHVLAEQLKETYDRYTTSLHAFDFLNRDLTSEEFDVRRSEVKSTFKTPSKHSNEDLHARFATITDDYETVPITCLPELSDKTYGIEKGKLWVVSGYTSGKKTWFALHLFLEIINSGKYVDFYSLEMSEMELFQRMVSVTSGVNASLFYRGDRLRGDEKESLLLASENLSKMSNYEIRKDLRTFSGIMSHIRRKNKLGKLDYVIIDYVQNIKEKGMKDEYERIGYIGRMLQDLSQETGVTVILLSQVSNEHAREPGSNVISTKGSGDLAASADIVIELYMDKQQRQDNETNVHTDSEQLTCHVRKNRHGYVGKVPVHFNKKCGKLYGVLNYSNASIW